MKIVYVRKVKGSGLTSKQKAALGTTAALLGVAGAAALAARNQRPVYAIDRVKADMDAQRLNQARDDVWNRPYVPTTPVAGSPYYKTASWDPEDNERIDDVQSSKKQTISNEKAYLKSRAATKELRNIPLRKFPPTSVTYRYYR
jgi:hypothetical protein